MKTAQAIPSLQTSRLKLNRNARFFATLWMTALCLVLAGPALAQLSGPKSIPGDYATIAAAITDLNAQGVGAGGVTFNVAAGYTETISAALAVTATGTAGNPIVFQKSGAGANPLVTAYTGGTGTPGSAAHDDIWRLVGSDYVTIDRIDLAENAANVANPATMEGGYVLYKESATNGCQNNTIQNCTITLNRVNNAAGSGPSVDGSRGIEVTNATPAAATTALSITAAAGSNSNNKFYTDTVQNANIGIAVIGFADVTPFTFADTNNDVGGASASTGNIIRNYGGGGTTSPAAGIRTLAQYGINISYNTINNNDGAGVNHGTTLRGIFNNTAVSASATITNNTITVKSAATTSALTAIENAAGATAASNTISISNNTITGCTYTTATSGAFTGITTTASAATVNLNSNILSSNSTAATSGTTNLIQNTGAATVAINMNSNNINGWTFTAATTSGTLNCLTNTGGASTAALSISSNNIQSITHSMAGATAHVYINNTAVTLSQAINLNTFTNLNVNTTAAVTFFVNAPSLLSTGSMSISNNSIVTGFNKAGTGGSVTIHSTNGSSVNGSTVTITGNNFSNITVTGAAAFTGFNNTDGASSSSGPTKTITGNTLNLISGGTGTMNPMTVNFSGAGSTVGTNTISNITWGAAVTGLTLGASNQATLTVSGNVIDPISTTAGAVTGISNAAPTATITGNSIFGLSSSAAVAVTGLATSGATLVNISKNKIYDLSGSNASTTVNGILVSAGTTVNVFNNLVGDLRATAASAADAIRGVSMTSTTATSNLNLSYNTVYLNASSAGANFGTSGIFHTTSATATTAALTLRNNIVVNLSTPNGTGLTAAYRRSSTTLTNYANASNNNLLYAGTPGASRLIFYDGTNSDQLIGAYQTRVNPRDANSVTENPPFLSTTGSNANFLHIDPSIATQVESGAQPVGGITDDYDGQARNVSTPDIGADEGNFTLADLAGPAINYTPLGNDSGTSTKSFTNVAVTDPSGVNTSPGTRPQVYYKKSTDANAVVDNTSGTNGWKHVEANGSSSPFDFTIDYSKIFGGAVAIGDQIQYFVVAQDQASPPNVSINSGTFATQPSTVNLAAGNFPIGGTIRSYTIVAAPLNGDYTVGTLLFNQVTGKNLTFERRVKTVVREVLEPEAQAPQMTGDRSNEDVNLPAQVTWKKVSKEVEEVSWVPMVDGQKYDGPLSVKRSDDPNLPAAAMSGIYATITAAVADLNLRGVSGPVRFLLTDPTYGSETFPITVNVASASVPNVSAPVTIKPNTGVTTSLSGAAASTAIFKIFNTNYITIDGSNAVSGTTRDWTIENTSVTSPQVVWFGSNGTTPVTNGSLKNCVVRNGVNTSSAVLISDGTTAGNPGYFANMEVRNNRVEKAFIGVYSNGGTTPQNGSGLTYADNDLSASGANAIRLVGLYMQGVNGATVSGNTVSNIEGATDETDVGIWLASGTINATVSQNTVSSIGYTGTGSFAPIGIDVTPGVSSNDNVTRNTVTNISTTGSTAVRGIASPVAGSADIIIQRNNVSGITNTNSGTYGAYGIEANAGNNHTIRNNFVSDLRYNMTGGIAFSTTFAVFGIRIGAGTGHVIADNSVNLFGALTGTANSSLLTAALAIVSTGSTGCDVRDNALSNTLTGGTTSIAHVSLYLPSGGTSAMNLTLNNNGYYSGSDAARQGIGQAGTTAGTGFYLAGNFNPGAITPAANMRAYTSTLSAAGTNDNASFAATASAPFQSNTDLHVNPSTPTQLSNNGASIGSITDDYDGDARSVTPDIGADEGNFTSLLANDVTAKAFIDPTNGGSKSSGIAFGPQASFENVGIANQVNVKVYYKIIGPAPDTTTVVYSDSTTIASLNVGGGPTTVTFANVTINVGGNYRMQARSGLPGDQNTANDVLNGAFDVLAPLCGNYLVGTGQPSPFNTLTGAVSRLNQVGVSCAVTFLLTDASYSAGETFPITINNVPGGSATNTVTIKPNPGVTAAISGSSASAVLVMNGCDYVTIDGSNNGTSSRDLTVTNTNSGTTTAVIWGQTSAASDPATNDNVKNVNVSGSSGTATLIGVGFGSTTISVTSNGNGNNNNKVENCSVSKSQYGIYSGGASAVLKNTGTVIRNNLVNTASPNNVTIGGILARFEDGVQVVGNQVGELSRASGTNFGISLGFQASVNLIVTSTYDEVTNGLVSANKVTTIVSPSTTGFSAVGIAVGPAASGTTTVVNNMVAGVTSSATPNDATLGVYARAATTGGGQINLWFNSVSMTGDRGSTATNPSFALGIAGLNPVIDVRDNILHNVQTSAGAGKSYAVGTADTVYTNMVSNYNDLYAAGASSGFARTGSLGNAGGTDRANLAAWQAATGKDGASISADPLFTSLLDLHIGNPSSPVGNAGIAIAGVTTDIDGETGQRSTTPDIGADEFAPPTPSITINDRALLEGNYPGTTAFVFTVSLSAASTDTVKVSYATANGTAAADTDYVKVAPPVQLVFTPGQTSKPVTITVIGDAYVEADETFFVNLTSPVGATISDAQGLGTIQNDDLVSGAPDQGVPIRTYLAANYPNPFQQRTTIAFGLHESGPVKLQIFDVSGRLVRSLVDGSLPARDQSVTWDGTDESGQRVASGFYILRMETKTMTYKKNVWLVR